MRRTIAMAMLGGLLAGAFVVIGAPSAHALETDLAISVQGVGRYPRSGLVPTGHTVTVLDPMTAVDVQTTHLVPAGAVLESFAVPSGSCSQTGTLVTCALGDLAGGTRTSVSLGLRMPDAAFAYDPEAEVAATNSNGDSTLYRFGPRILVGGFDLAIGEQGSPPLRVPRGGPFTYVASIKNLNYDDAPDATLAFTLPTEVGFSGYSTTGGTATCNVVVNRVTCATGPVSGRDASGVRPLDIAFELLAPNVQGTRAWYVSVATSTPELQFEAQDEYDQNNEDRVEISIGPALDEADLWVTLSGPAPVAPNATAFHELIVGNRGGATATNLVASVAIPLGAALASFEFKEGSGTCVEVGGFAQCVISPLPPAQRARIWVGLAAPRTFGTMTVEASATAAEVDPDLSNNVASDTTDVGGAVTDVWGYASIVSGTTESQYSLRVSNAGPELATDVVLTVDPPAGHTLASFNVVAGSGSCTEVLGTILCELGDLGVAGVADVELSVMTPRPIETTFSSLVSVTSSTPSHSNPMLRTIFANVLPAPPCVVCPSVSIGDAAAFEGDLPTTRTIKLPVTLDLRATQTVTVDYVISALTTTGGGKLGDIDDKLGKVGRLTFRKPANQVGTAVTKFVTVTINPDIRDEGDETFTVTLSNPVGVRIEDGEGLGTVLDDDPGTGQRMGIGSASAYEGDAGRTKATVMVSLAHPAVGPTSVRVMTGGGTAAPGTDYKALDKLITFKPGQRFKAVTVVLVPNAQTEIDRTIELSLIEVNGAGIQNSGVGTITVLDDDD